MSATAMLAVVGRSSFRSSIQQHWEPLAHLNNLATRHCSSGSSSSSDPSNDSSSSSSSSDGEYSLVYQGFFGKPHKRLKYISLLNTFASFAAAPLIISYSSASPIARVAVTTSVIAFAVITTGGLHWFTSPYVHRLLYNQKADRLRVQTLSLLGGTRWSEFPADSVSEPTGYHPLASFKANGRVFYVDRANFLDAALLQRLVPAAPTTEDNDDGQPESEQQQEQQQQPRQQPQQQQTEQPKHPQ